MPNAEFRYPDELSPSVSYVPSKQPTIPFRSGPHPGINQEQLADGSVRSKRIHPSVKRFTRQFQRLTNTDYTNRETFADAVAGREFRYRDEIQSAWITVMFTGASLEPLAWEPQGSCVWRRLEEFVEVPVPSVDALGAIRTGTVTISNSELFADEPFSAAFTDASWIMPLPGIQRTSGAPAPNYWIEHYNGGGSRSSSGFRIRVSIEPGSGQSYTFEYLAVGS